VANRCGGCTSLVSPMWPQQPARSDRQAAATMEPATGENASPERHARAPTRMRAAGIPSESSAPTGPGHRAYRRYALQISGAPTVLRRSRVIRNATCWMLTALGNCSITSRRAYKLPASFCINKVSLRKPVQAHGAQAGRLSGYMGYRRRQSCVLAACPCDSAGELPSLKDVDA
jgi:hypothetical protein